MSRNETSQISRNTDMALLQPFPILDLLKVCDVTQFYAPGSGGVRRYVDARGSYVNADNRHRQILIVPGNRYDSTTSGRSTIYRIHSPRVDLAGGYRALINLERLREIIHAEKPDLIECADPYQLAWTVLDISRELKIPAVAFYHSHFPDVYLRIVSRLGASAKGFVQKYSRLYVNELYNRFCRTLVPSAALADLLTTWGVANLAPVQLGVDTETFRPGPRNLALRDELNVCPDQILLLYTGRLAYEKNLRTLLCAHELLNRRSPGKYRLHFVGDGPLKYELAASARNPRGITFQSHLGDSKALAEQYRAADIFVHPGLMETFGLTTLEAQACALPVIGIRGSFMDALAFTGIEYWASENSPESLAAAISRFSRLQTRDIGIRAAQPVHERFSWTETFNRLFSLYETALVSK